MIPISVYMDGETRNGPYGMEYSCDSKFTFPGNEDTRYEDVKNTIYKWLGIFESQYSLNVVARYNTAIPPSYHFCLIPIRDDVEWRMILQMAQSEMNWRFVELYVDLVPNRTNENPDNLGRTGENVVNTDEEPPRVSQETLPYSPGHTLHISPARHSPIIDLNEPISNIPEENEGDDDENILPVAGEWETGEDYGYTSDEDDLDYNPNDHPNHRIIVQGRSEKYHPVQELSDISGFNEIYTEVQNSSDDPLAENRVFNSKDQLQWTISEYHIKGNIEIKTERSSATRLVMVCKDQRCFWRLYAVCPKGNNFWTIRTNPYPHTCIQSITRVDHAQLTAKIIAGAIKKEMNEDTTMTIKNVRHLVKAKFPGADPSYAKLWRGRELAIAKIFGTWEGSYALLPRYFNAIQSTNPSMKYAILTTPTNQPEVRYFHAAAWAWGPCIEAVKYIRPVISIDAGFLSGRYEGRLLMACGYDAENQLIPLAFALVEKEDLENWGWFMNWLRREVIGPGKMCVLSDRHKGIKAVFEYPQYGWSEANSEAVHRYCMQHVAENLYSKFPDDNLKKLFKRAASKKKPRRFKEHMQSIKAQYPGAYEYLKTVGKRLENDPKESVNPSKWAQRYDNGYRWGIMTSNGSESLNRVFKAVRMLPVVAIVEGTWYKCVSWFDDRRIASSATVSDGFVWSRSVTEKLIKRGDKSRPHRVDPYRSEQGDFEVLHQGETLPNGEFENFKYHVLLEEGVFTRCTCLKPNLTGIPCSHVLAVIRVRHLNLSQFVSPYYTAANLHDTWSGRFHPFPNQYEWLEYTGPTIIPNRKLLRRGRRRHIRIPMVMDEMEGRKGKRRGRPLGRRPEGIEMVLYVYNTHIEDDHHLLTF